jgi:type III secretory pathway component EscT
MLDEILHFLHVTLFLWLRCVPLFLLTPYLAVGLAPGVWAALLSWAFAGSLAPLVLASCDGCAAVVFTPQTVISELSVGVVIALSLGLPCAAFRITGAIAQALAGSNAAAGSELGKLAGLVALVAIASAGAFSGAADLLLTVSPPLSAAKAPDLSLLRPLSDQVLRAFELGVSLSGPLLLAAVVSALVAGLIGRGAGLQLSSVGPALLPWLGIAIVCLCVANWLDSLPELVRAFARNTTRLLE